MREEVKITVIATGFRASGQVAKRPRNAWEMDERPTPTITRRSKPDPFVEAEPEPEPEPVAIAPEEEIMVPRDLPNLSQINEPELMVERDLPIETLRAVGETTFEQDDLDIPAFLRKRQ
jgi:hypothetical protein